MAILWYVSRDNKTRTGPHSLDQLRELAAAGQLRPEDMVLPAGERRWAPAGSIDGLFAPGPGADSPPAGPRRLPLRDQARQAVRQFGRLPVRGRVALAAGAALIVLLPVVVLLARAAQPSASPRMGPAPDGPAPAPAAGAQRVDTDPPPAPPRGQERKAEPGAEPSPAAAPDAAQAIVVAEGVGATGEEALKDAFRNAVRQVVGALVDAETLIQNDQVVADKVLTYSDGFVPKYEELSKQQDRGLVRVRIKATVERRSVAAKLQAANVSLKKIDGKSIYGEIVSKQETAATAQAMVAKALEGFPLNVLTAEVVGKPEVVKQSGDKVDLAITVVFKIDPKAYEAFRTRLQRVLDQVRLEPPEEFTLVNTPVQGMAPPKGVTVRAIDRKTSHRKDTPETMTVVVNTQSTGDAQRTEWTHYVLDQACGAPLQACVRTPTVKLSLLRTGGGTVAVDRFPADARGNDWHIVALPIWRKALMPRGNFREAYNAKGGCFTISPFFFHEHQSRVSNRTVLTNKRVLSLTLEEVKAIDGLKCELIP